tara:strand:+ start:643 stop:2880 length:2238 start_codon:yes stop_codon:yes gene_type:complete
MTSSYGRNIDRLRAAERQNAQKAINQRNEMAQRVGERGIRDAEKIGKTLEKFSPSLKKIRDAHIKESTERGRLEAIKQSNIDSKKLYELQAELDGLTEMDTDFHTIKKQMLKLSGPDVYPEADRIAHLSPLEQVGFQKEKLRTFKNSYADKLDYSMANSDEQFTYQNLTFTPKQLHANNTYGMPFKEAAVDLISEKIIKAAGLDKFSPEMLEISGVNSAIQKAKEGVISKYRKRYNVDASSVTRTKAELEWKTSEKTGVNIHHFLVKNAATQDKDNNTLFDAGAWKLMDSVIVKEAVALNDLSHIDKILDQEIPPALAKQLGIEQGTLFSEHWKKKKDQLKTAAKKAIKEAVNAEKEYLQSQNTLLGNQFDEEKRKGEISTERLQEYEDESYRLGGTLDTRIQKYKTVSERSAERDTEKIKDLIASQDGAIYDHQLDEFNPRAAVEFRDDAAKFEAALKKSYNVEGIIKGQLNETWADAGIKQNEKKTVWEFSLAQANKAYTEKFNTLIKMGYPPDAANRLALHAKLGDVKGKDNEPLPEFEGVVEHLKRTKATNDYTRYGEEANASLKDADVMVSKIREGKDQMMKHPLTIATEVIGGNYGKNHLNTIKRNMQIYGTWDGIRKSEAAFQYYQGLARGKRGVSPYGLIDLQLKAADPLNKKAGIWPDRKDHSENDYTSHSWDIMAPLLQEGSSSKFNEVFTNREDVYNYQNNFPSMWNLPENLNPIFDTENYLDFSTPINFGENN